jgi:DNA mismatch endonuclease (patch repair protein)
MADNLTPEQRHSAMAAVKSVNTSPELAVRRALHAKGFRFRLHRRDLPGKPDIVLPKFRTVIFINGCFWHQHLGCKKSALPVKNQDYWRTKLEGNRHRDAANLAALAVLGWRVIVVWNCEIKKRTMDSIIASLDRRIRASQQ